MGWGYGWKILLLWEFTETSDLLGGRVHEKPIYRGRTA